jgi:hypothetical protein
LAGTAHVSSSLLGEFDRLVTAANTYEGHLQANRRPGDPPARDYFSLLDPNSFCMNFDTLEKKPYLFFVQYDTKTEDAAMCIACRFPFNDRNTSSLHA